MPLMLDVHLRRGLRTDGDALHRFTTAPGSQSETRTLYHVHDLGGHHLTIVTDDLHYDPTRWGQQAHWQVKPYQPRVSAGNEREFLVTLNRERRNRQRPGMTYQTAEELDTLLTRLMDRAGAEVLEYDVRHNRSTMLKGGLMPTATFRGLLRVSEPSLFYQASLGGIGRGKRFGCGLLLTRQPPPLIYTEPVK